MTPQTDGDPRLHELLLRWQELRGQGQSISTADLCSTCPELAEELDRRIARFQQLDALLDETRTATGSSSESADIGGGARESASARAVFRDLRFHAAGALGEVFLARNAELNRDVALKFIRPSHAGDPESQRRFLQEAEVTGRLEHPGVVPIYALGTDAAGVPCYAMRFIRGETLQDAIDAFHAADRAGRDPSERSLALRELLGRFVSICNTMAYAHSRGIVHRDLKPRNVMLGKYDETLVVDWGLAKAVGRGDEAAGIGEETLVPLASGNEDGSDTPTIGIVGTPAYMSPEQAEAGSPRIGPASDVFGLGAVLYTVLAGRAPYHGRTLTEVLDAVRRCEFPRPRQIKPEVPRALEAICLKAMAARPEDRYPTALDLAADVDRWMADEPVSALPESRAARIRRWVRRHPRLVTGSAAAVIVATVAMVAITAMITASNRRLGDANRTIRRNSDRIAEQNRELERRNQDLVQARGEAEQERDRAREVTAFLVSTFRKPDPEMDGRNVKVADVLKGAIKELEDRSRIAPATRASIFAAIGQTYGGLGLYPEAVTVFERALEIRRRELGDGHLDTIGATADLASACWVAGQYDRAIRLGEQVVRARAAKQGDDHPDTLEAMNNLAVCYEDAGQLDRAISLYQQTLERQKATLGEDHLGTVMTMHNLANATMVAGHAERAIPTFEKAIAFYRARKGDKDPNLLEMINNLARAYTQTSQLDRALTLHHQVRDARLAKLGPDHPLTLTSTNNLATVFLMRGEAQRAVSLLEGARAIVRAKAGSRDPAALFVMNNLARAYQATGRLDLAIPLFEEVLAAHRGRLGGDHPDILACQRNLAGAYDRAGRLGDAERAFRQVVEAAGRARPRNDRFYSDALAGLGGCLIRRKKPAAAVPILRECLQIKDKTQPGDWSTAEARGLLGEALSGLKDFAVAEPLLLESQKALAERAEAIPRLQREDVLRDARERLVRLYELWNKPAEADRWKRLRRASPPQRVEPATGESRDTRSR